MKGPDDGPYGEYGITVKKDGVSVAVTGGINTLTSTLYEGEQVSISARHDRRNEEWKETQVANMKNTLAQVHVYYVDTDHSLKAAWWHVSEGQWKAGLINDKGYKASSGSGISSLGYQELHGQPGDYKLKVYFKDRDNDDKLTVAYYKDHKWDKKVVK